MGKLLQFFQKAKGFLKNKKYLIVLLALGVTFVFFDDFNLRNRISNTQTINRLESDIAHYERAIETSMRQREELHSSERNLVRFAREEYFMKKANEDIFILDER